MKKILVVGAGIVQVPIIKKCKELGLRVIATDVDKNAPGMYFADIALSVDTYDKQATLKVAKQKNIDGIITTSDYPVRTVAYVCKNLGLKGISERAAEICTNKYLLRESLSKNNIPCPKYWKINNNNEVHAIKSEFSYPLIVKPVDSSASRGVTKVNDYIELKDAIKEALTYSKNGNAIIEQFLEGAEYSVESLTQNGKTEIIAITEKTTRGMNNSYFVEDRHVIPANISIKEKQKIESLVLKAIKVIGIDNCGTHTEIKLTRKGPIIIEIGARLGGDYITSDLVPLSTGVNMLENVINISIGCKINIEKTKSNYSGIQFINSGNYNFIKKYLEKIKSKTGYVRSELKEYKNNDLKNSLDRLGYYICIGNNSEELENILDYN